MKAFRDALVTIANADAGVAAITARNGQNMLPWANIGDLPNEGIAYEIIAEIDTPQSKRQKRVFVTFSCFGKNIANAEALADRLQAEGASGMFIHPKFYAEGVDACPMGLVDQRDATDIEGDGRKENRIDVDLQFEVLYQ